MKILIVDRHVCEVDDDIKFILEDLGHNVYLVQDISEAEENIKKQNFDRIIVCEPTTNISPTPEWFSEFNKYPERTQSFFRGWVWINQSLIKLIGPEKIIYFYIDEQMDKLEDLKSDEFLIISSKEDFMKRLEEIFSK